MRHPTKTDSLARLKRLGLPIGSIIDVGVLSSTPELIAAFPDKKHLLIEPIVEWTDAIATNYRAIDYELVNVAASDSVGSVTLEVQSVIPGQPISHARMSDNVALGCESRIVPMATVDALMHERTLEGPHLLKIDVDGAELRILRGAEKTLQNCSVVVIEAGLINLFERSKPLKEAGFDLFDIIGLAYYDDRLCCVDLVFVKGQLMRDLKLGIFEQPFDFSKWVNYAPS